MLGWDSNDDQLMDIHSSETANSDSLAGLIYTVDSVYQIGLSPVIYSPGTQASDHSSFWDYDWGAVLLIEAYYGDDFNPYYHSTDDRVSNINLPYYHKMSKLSLGSVASLAEVIKQSVIEDKNIVSYKMRVYPNPTHNTITIDISNSEKYDLEIFSINGQLMLSKQLYGKEQEIDLSFLNGGIYFLTLSSEHMVITRKVVKL
jgi:hypothetical protein